MQSPLAKAYLYILCIIGAPIVNNLTILMMLRCPHVRSSDGQHAGSVNENCPQRPACHAHTAFGFVHFIVRATPKTHHAKTASETSEKKRCPTTTKRKRRKRAKIVAILIAMNCIVARNSCTRGCPSMRDSAAHFGGWFSARCGCCPEHALCISC